jgi:hypothetical protein
MDNFKFDMTSQGDLTLKAALKLFNPPGGKVTGYRVEKDKGLIFYWADSSPHMTKLPFPMTLEQAADFAVGWLDHADYGNRPSFDGDSAKGWRLYTESWGHIGGDHYAFAAVQPVWAMYGK